MDVQYTIYVIALFVSAPLCAAIGIYAWRRRSTRGAIALGWAMLLATWMTLMDGLSLVSRTEQAAWFWYELRFIGLAFLPTVLFIFALQYTGQQERLRFRWLALLLLIPTITQVLIWTNSWHGLWGTDAFSRTGAFMLSDPATSKVGAWFWVHAAYGYLSMLAAFGWLMGSIVRSFQMYRSQALALLLGMSLSIAGSIISLVHYSLQWFPGLNVNTTSIGGALGVMVLAWAVFRYRLLDVVPVARAALIENLSDGMLVLDAQGRVVDFNPAMQAILGFSSTSAIGRPVEQVLGRMPDIVERLQAGQDTRTEVRLERGGMVYYYDLHLLTLNDNAGRVTGRLLTMRDVTERKLAEEERERLISELNAYAHTVAHDLKSPLSSIIGYATLLEQSGPETSPDYVRGRIQDITRIGFKMSNIIDELLLLASVRGMEQVKVEPLDMAALVASVQGRLNALIKERGAEIVLPEHWPPVSSHAPWVEEVWANYISNAIKYGGQPPHIELGAVEEGAGIHFWVRDNGPGLSPEQQALLFTQFTQLHETRAKGHGLGLSIVQRIIQRLGGQVGVESTPGQGSTFFFTLPR